LGNVAGNALEASASLDAPNHRIQRLILCRLPLRRRVVLAKSVL